MDTIVSPASAPVSQAIGVVRVSGPKALELSAKMLRIELPVPGTFAFRDVYNPSSKKLIDSGLILVFKSPASFTGEDIVEFQLHGSPAVLEEVTGCIEKLGARHAQAGEFSLRALVNGKASLPELELANALSNLKTPSGNIGISTKIESWRIELTKILAGLEAGISFPNDSQTDMQEVHKNIDFVRQDVSKVLSNGKPGVPKIALAGKQNAGKSTLFNRMVGINRMVVSEVAGTTRDFLSMEIKIEGRICQLFDGPGLEVVSDDSGQVLYSGFLKTADVVVWLDQDGVPPENQLQNMIFVKSKSDVDGSDKDDWINICSKNGAGIVALTKKISETLPKQEFALSQRQHDVLKNLAGTLQSSLKTDVDELVASDLQFAVGLLSELDGIGLSGEVLSSIFSTFCIGK